MTEAGVSNRQFDSFALWTACTAYLVGYAGYSLSDVLGPIRYLVYGAPLILIVLTTCRRDAANYAPAIVLFFLYAVLSIVDYGLYVKDFNFFVIDFVIVNLVIICFIPEIIVTISVIRVVFAFSLAYFVVAFLTADNSGIRLFSILQNDTVSGLDKGYDNHQGGLVGPIYAVFSIAVGAKIEFCLALAMSVLGGKRIGVAAILIGMFSILLFQKLLLFQKFARLKKRQMRFVVLLGILTIINATASNLTTISDRVYESLNINVPIEEIMLGRHMVGVEMSRILDSRPIGPSLFGYGPGSADALASLVTDGDLKEPHNDWMKILYDYGIVGSIAITTFIAIIFSRSTISASIAIASAIIMTTDNVLIYLYYQFPIALMVAYSTPRQPPVPEASPTVDQRSRTR